MGNVNFYLKAPSRASGKSLIYLKYKFNGQVLVFAFGQNIDPENWNTKKQRVKNNKITTIDGQYRLNDLLDTLSIMTRNAYNSAIKNGIPRPDTLKKKLNDFVYKKGKTDKPNFYDLIDRFITGEIKHKGRTKTISTLKVYTSCKNHLKEFEEIKKYEIDFDTITLDFYYKFVEYLQNRGTKHKAAIEQLRKKEGKVNKSATPIVDLDTNTIAKYLSKIKLFMGEAVELKYTTNRDFESKKFSIPKSDSDAVYLSDKELEALYNYNFSNDKRLEKVRDLFVFGCYIGLRFTDYSTIKKENIVNVDGDMFIKVITQKTKELVIIPCNPIVLDIFKKYGENNNKLPKSISNQKFNEYIKEACRIAGLTSKGRLLGEPEKEIWECVSSHTARRSFATNYYLEGFPTIDLMKITGHKTEKSFLTYIRVSKLDAAKHLNQHMKRRWEEKRIKANDSLLNVA